MGTSGQTRGASTAGLAVLALLGFAGNSLFCRAAMAGDAIDPVAFTAIRIVSGALVLAFSVGMRPWAHGSWLGAGCLFAYALAFSLAYVQLPAGLGALVLFGTVQCTMLGWAIARGERPDGRTWVGWLAAAAGLAWLLFPQASAEREVHVPSLGLMALAGAAWGAYSLLGRGEPRPLEATAGNFVRGSSMALVAIFAHQALGGAVHLSTAGVGWAVASGVVASGLGYACWFAALRGLTRTRAAVIQLTVPVVAALMGILLLGEVWTATLAISGGLVLGGVAFAVVRRPRRACPVSATDRRA